MDKDQVLWELDQSAKELLAEGYKDAAEKRVRAYQQAKSDYAELDSLRAMRRRVEDARYVLSLIERDQAAPQPAAAAPREPAPVEQEPVFVVDHVGTYYGPNRTTVIVGTAPGTGPLKHGAKLYAAPPAPPVDDELQRDAELLSKKWRKEAEVLREEVADEQSGLITGLISCAHELDAAIQARRQQGES